MTIRLESHTLCLQQRPLTAPSWRRAALFIHHTMTRQQLCSWCIPQGSSHHPRMTRPSSPRSDMAIGRHLSTWYLADDVQYVVTKPQRLLWCHLVGIILHYSASLALKRYWCVCCQVFYLVDDVLVLALCLEVDGQKNYFFMPFMLSEMRWRRRSTAMTRTRTCWCRRTTWVGSVT